MTTVTDDRDFNLLLILLIFSKYLLETLAKVLKVSVIDDVLFDQVRLEISFCMHLSSISNISWDSKLVWWFNSINCAFVVSVHVAGVVHIVSHRGDLWSLYDSSKVFIGEILGTCGLVLLFWGDIMTSYDLIVERLSGVFSITFTKLILWLNTSHESSITRDLLGANIVLGTAHPANRILTVISVLHTFFGLVIWVKVFSFFSRWKNLIGCVCKSLTFHSSVLLFTGMVLSSISKTNKICLKWNMSTVPGHISACSHT